MSISSFFKEWSYDRVSQFAASVVAGKEVGCMERAGEDFDPRVVEAFVTAFRKGGMEVPDVVVLREAGYSKPLRSEKPAFTSVR